MTNNIHVVTVATKSGIAFATQFTGHDAAYCADSYTVGQRARHEVLRAIHIVIENGVFSYERQKE